MQKRIAWIATLAAVLLASSSMVAAQKPTIIPTFEIPYKFSGDFKPKKLPKRELAPIEINLAGWDNPTDGVPAPQLREMVIEVDRTIAIDVEGLPVCVESEIKGRDTKEAEEACADALIGRGKVEVEVARPGKAPFVVKSKLRVFNRGDRARQTIFFVHAYLSSPESTSVVARARVSKVRNGRYGMESIMRIPRLADGYGSVKSFSLSFGRGHVSTPYLFARCWEDRLQGRVIGAFADGTQISGPLLRPCTPQG